MHEKTHTRWCTSIKPGETKVSNQGVKVTNRGDHNIKVILEVPTQFLTKAVQADQTAGSSDEVQVQKL